MRKKKQLVKIVKYLVIAVVALATVAGTILNNVSPIFATTKVADLPTHDKYTESLGEDVSTEYSGRVWTDKTVYEEKVTFSENGNVENFSVAADNNFLVSFSALATSQQVIGETQAPIDVVFIIDISGSMSNQNSGMDNGNSRIYNTVVAVNDAIDELMAVNPYTRVAVVGFSTTATTLLPLDRYTKANNQDYFELNRQQASQNYAVLTTNAINSNNQTVYSRVDVQGGTNIQMGLYQGMSILANNTDVSVKIDGQDIKRTPSVILLSDGAPTYSSTSTSWWSPANNGNDGPGRNIESGTSFSNNASERDYYIGNGIKALMTGAYMKAAIDRNYQSSVPTTLYTVGMGITGISNSKNERDLAYATLDPGNTRTGAQATNVVRTEILTNWNTYTTNNGTPRVNVGSQNNYGRFSDDYYTITHPQTNDISGDALIKLVDKYHAADDANTLTNAFKDIVSSISLSAPEVPTAYDVTNPMGSGYITYTDPIGEYMEVKAIKAVIYDGKAYDVVENNGTYTVENATITTSIHGDHLLNEVIDLSVTETNGQEVLTVKIPGGLIPIRINKITLSEENGETIVESNVSNQKTPIRVVYEVGLKDGVIDSNGVVNQNIVSQEYIDANLNQDGSVNFYTNLYKKNTAIVNGELTTVGEATVHFEPSHTNKFYYIQENTPIYMYNSNGTKGSLVTSVDQIKNNPETLFCYEETYYYLNEIKTELVVRTGAQLANTEIAVHTDENDNDYISREIGSYRPNRIGEFEGTKSANATKTAQDFYAPTFEGYAGNPYEGEFVIYLGNNGVISFAASGSLRINKTVTADSGLTAPDATFEFKVNLKDASGNALTDNYPVGIYNANGTLIDSTVRTVTDGGSIYLKANQYAQIMYLPHGATYTVEEVNVPGGFTQTAMTDSGNGTIVAGTQEVVAFTNNYSVQPAIVKDAIRVDKTLKGRDWNSEDSFTFVIESQSGVLPENTEVVITKETNERLRYFGPITFTKPGQYTYYITENIDSTSNGITYSRAIYEVVITVTDNHDGTMSTNVVMTQTATDNNQEVDNVIADNIARFTNVYSAEEQDWSPRISKTYIDHVGSNPLKDHMFTFTITAEDGSPMPNGATSIQTSNIGTLLTFARRTFTTSDIGNSYTYKIVENIPNGHVNNVYNGMTYDPTEIYVTVSTSYNGGILVITTEYYKLDSNNHKVILDSPTFTNEYNAAPVTVDLEGTKVLSGRDWNNDIFTFTIEAANEETKNTVNLAKTSLTVNSTTAQAGDAVAFAFENIEFNKLGVYTFNIKETPGNAGGIDYDENICTVTVTVTDTNTDGQLEASVVYSNTANDSTTNASFTNVYTTTPYVFTSLNGNKVLETNVDTKFLAYGDFQFEIQPLNGAPMGDSRTINLNGPASTATPKQAGIIELLKNIVFTKPGEYKYVIKEIIPTGAVNNKYLGTTYDPTEYTVTITVTDNLNGALEATYEIKANGNVVSDIVFTNKYEVKPEVITATDITKVIVGRDFKQNESFNFTLTLVQGDEKNVEYTKNASTQDVSGNTAVVKFGNITFKEVGTYVFVIKEVIPSTLEPGLTYSTYESTREFIVTDNGHGGLTVTRGESGNLEFVNTYSTQPTELEINVSKTYVDEVGDSAWEAGNHFDIYLEGYGETLSVIGTDVVFVDGDDTTDDAAISRLVLSISNSTITEKTVEKTISKVKFNKAGIYQFVVYENATVTTQIPGVVYDTVGRIVTVTVTDQLDGTLQPTITSVTNNRNETYTNNEIHFTNVYNPNDVVLSGHDYLSINKVLNGREWLDGDQFVFTIEPSSETQIAIDKGDVVMPKDGNNNPMTTVTVTKENVGHIHFGSIEFKDEGEYSFTIKEIVPTDTEGITYDSKPITVTVKTEIKNETNSLEIVSVTYTKDGAAINDLTFTNTYATEPISVDVPVTKVLAGREWSANDKFEFTITPNFAISSTDPEVEIVNDSVEITSTTDQHKGKFAIKFNKVGRYSFIINETVPQNTNGVTYDATPRYITIEITDNNDGTLSYAFSHDDLDEYTTFTNVYSADSVTDNLVLGKELLHHGITDREFAFQATLVSGNEDGITYPSGYIYNVGENLDFGNIVFTKAGEYVLEVREIIPTEAVDNFYNGITYDNKVITVKYVVEDNGKGKLGIKSEEYTDTDSNSENNTKFTNVYQSTGSFSIPVTKEFSGRTNANGAHDVWEATDKFTFNLSFENATVNGNQLTAQETIDKGYIQLGNTTTNITSHTRDFTNTFGNIIIHKDGTYIFKVTEENTGVHGIAYDSTVFTVKVVAVDNGNGGITFTLTDENNNPLNIVFKNTFTPDPVTLDGELRLPVIKNFTGRPNNVWLDEDKFTFTISGYDDATIQAIANDIVVMDDPTSIVVTKDNKDSAHFNDIRFTKAGTYKFEVKEVVSQEDRKDYITYDTDSRIVTVVVGDRSSTLTIDSVTIDVNGNKAETLTFNNIYDTKSVTLIGDLYLEIEKVLNGREWNSNDEFNFVLWQVDENGAAINDPNVIIAEGGDCTSITKDDYDASTGKYADSFGNITFKEPGYYIFKVEELLGSIDNLTYDTHVLYIYVTVKDNNMGHLVTSVDYYAVSYANPRVFTNTYTPDPITVSLTGTKVISGRDLRDSDVFTFTIEAITAGAPLPASTTTQNGMNGTDISNIQFDAITFEKEGTYEYKITETGGSYDGVTNDSGYVIATVVVDYDESTGTFSSTVTYKDEDNGNEFKFNNVYQANPVTIAEITGIKEVDGLGAGYTISDGDFTFKIYPDKHNPSNDPISEKTVTNTGTNFTFGQYTYTASGKYTYHIHEVLGSIPGMSYDATIHTIVVDVTDDGNGQLAATVTGNANIVIKNTYKPDDVSVEIVGNKELVGKELASNQFSFELTAKTTNAPMPSGNSGGTVSNKEDGSFAFEPIHFTQVGTYEYVVKEVKNNFSDPYDNYTFDSKEYDVTIVIGHDQNSGSLVVDSVTFKLNEQPVGEIEFVNTYTPNPTKIDGEITIKKSLVGRDLVDGEFDFELLDGTTVVATGTNVGNTVSFNSVEGHSITAVGSYSYTIREVNTPALGGVEYDTNTYTVTFDVEDVNGKLTITNVAYGDLNEVVFKNTYTPTPTTVQFGAGKWLEGRPLNDGEFTFEKVYVSGKDADNNDVAYGELYTFGDTNIVNGVATTTNDENGVVLFAQDTITAAGEFVIEVREQKGTVGGVTYSDHVVTYTVKVTDNLDGHLSATYEVVDNHFVNTYEAKDALLTITATKKLINKTLEDGEFTFILKDGEGKEVATTTNKTDGIIEFKDVVFKEAGTFVYTITEVVDNEEPIVYDTNTYPVRIVVTDDLKGQLHAAVADSSENVVFTNTYKAPEITVEKVQVISGVEHDHTHGLVEVKPGDEVTYVIRANNAQGVATAKKTVITDKIPEGLELVSISNNGTQKDGIITWTIGDLEAGKNVEVSFTVKVPEVEENTEWENIATVKFNNGKDPENPDEPNETKETNKVEINVELYPDLDGVKTQSVNGGEATTKAEQIQSNLVNKIKYVITVTAKEGTNDATNVVVTDEIPAGTTLVEGSITNGGVEKDGVITWTFETLEPGKSITLEFEVEVAKDVDVEEIKNQADITWEDEPDEDGDDPKDFDEPTNEVEIEIEEVETETGDENNIVLYAGVLGVAGIALVAMVVLKKKKEQE